MLAVFVGVWLLALVSLPFYLVYLSLVFRRTWETSRALGLLMVLVVPGAIALLMSPTLYY